MRVQFVRNSKEGFGVSSLNRKKVISGVLAGLFVIAAGIFYMSRETVGKQEDAQLLVFSEEVSEKDGQTDDEVLQQFSEKQSEPEASAEDPVIYVHVCGAVKNPGVYVLTEGTRVVDAVEAAGGFTSEAAKEVLNQAVLLKDGEQLYVYREEEARELGMLPGQAVQTVPEVSETDAVSTLININTASAAELMQLPGIGQAKAEAILAYRTESGGFREIAELMQIPGIKESIFEKVKDRITVRDE